MKIFIFVMILFIATQIHTLPFENFSSTTDYSYDKTTVKPDNEEASTISLEFFDEEIKKFPEINKEESKIKSFILIDVDLNDFPVFSEQPEIKNVVEKSEDEPAKTKREIIFRPLFVYQQEQEKKYRREKARKRSWWKKT